MIRAIDVFAGFGGFTKGAKMAGVKVLWAANHWPLAVDFHTLNNPDVAHACQDMKQFNFGLLPDFDLALLAPCCQGYSRGRKRNNPAHDASRATAWSVIDCLEAKRPPFAIIENVPEFKKWALFPVFCQAAEALGYTLSFNEWNASWSGVRQDRMRLLIVATRSRNPIVLKRPDHPALPISDLIQWDSHRWSPIRSPRRSVKTVARAERGRADFGDRFVMPYYSKGSGLTGRSLDRPIGTLTTKARWAVVDGDRMRMLQPDEARAAMGFPDDYVLPKNKALANHLIGNAICPPQARDVIQAVLAAA